MASANIIKIDGMDYIRVTDTSLGRRLQYSQKLGKYTQRQWLQAHNEVMQILDPGRRQMLANKDFKNLVIVWLAMPKEARANAKITGFNIEEMEANSAMSIKFVFASYLDDFCRSETASRTAIDRARRQCGLLLDFFAKNHIMYYSQLKREHAQKYIEWRKTNRMSSGDKDIGADTINQEIRRLASVIKHGIKYHKWPELYLLDGIRVRQTQENTKSIRPFEIAEVKTILAWLWQSAETTGNWYLHDMALLSVCSGMEAKALTLLNESWVKRDLGILRVYDKLISGVLDAKTQNRARDIPLSPTMLQIFDRGYVFERPGSRRRKAAGSATPIHHYSSKAFAKCEAETGIKDVDWHRFRHTCATARLSSGWQLIRVSRMLGHSSINTTAQHYAEYDLSASPEGFEGMVAVYKAFVEWLDGGYFA